MDDTGFEVSTVDDGGGYDLDEDDDEYEYLALPEVDEEFLDEFKQEDTQVLSRIPFGKIHESPVPFESPKRRCFMPGQKILVQINEVEHTDTGLFNPNLYVIQLTHGDYHWTIRRRYKHFRALHDSLMIFRAKVAVAVPTKTVKERRKSFAVRKQNLPKFPKTPEPLVRTDNIANRKQQLESYLQNLVRHPQFRNHVDTLKFLEVSHLTFINGLGAKWREGMMRKRAGGRRIKLKACGCFPACHCTANWNSRWLILKDTFVAYMSARTGAIGDVMLMDRDFNIQNGLIQTGVSHGLVISNLSRHLLMKCETHRQAEEWVDDLQKAVRQSGQQFTQPNRYHSFAPVRGNSTVNWFVDGANYMAAVADAIEGAKEEIFITDWWLSPELYLKRPITEEQTFRLDLLLGRKAAQGVHVYVLVFKEMEVALGINSFHTKQTLVRQHPNIRVLRHPDGITLWSHHEKIVCIDQRIAFLGGIDLCFGRWDTRSHRLTDLGLKTVATDLDDSGEDSEEEALDIITEEPENDEEFVNININNNSNGKDDQEVTHSNGHHDNTELSPGDVLINTDQLNSSAESESNGLLGKSKTRSRNGADLNVNNSGNGDDARMKQQKAAQRAHNMDRYPPPPTAHNMDRCPPPPIAFSDVKLHWDGEVDGDTEESDVEMGTDYDRVITTNKLRSDRPLRLDPDRNGSYSNPDVDRMTKDEAGTSRKPKRGSGSHGYVPEDDYANGSGLSGHGLLSNSVQGNHHGGHLSDDSSDLDTDNLTGQGHLGPNLNGKPKVKTVNFQLKNDTPPGQQGQNGGNSNKSSQKSELSVVVSGNGDYWKICDNSKSNPNSSNQVCDNDDTMHGANGRPMRKLNTMDSECKNIPRIEITDTSRQGRAQAKPILRQMEQQRTFDAGGARSDVKDLTTRTPVDAGRNTNNNTNTSDPMRSSSELPAKRSPVKPPPPKSQTARKLAMKQDSVGSTTSSESVEGVSESGEGSAPKSFKTYLQTMMQQVLSLEANQAQEQGQGQAPDIGSDHRQSVFQTGLSGLQVGYSDHNDNRVSPARNTPPTKKRGIRPPKLSMGMMHFGKGSRAMDDDTAASLADTGGRLPSPTLTEPTKARYIAPPVGGGGDLDESVNLSVQPKATTPEPKKKQYDIKERFRKNKMMSIDVTDDSFAHPWKDRAHLFKASCLEPLLSSIQDTREILNPHELLEEEGREGEVRFWIGKDYANFIYKDFVDLDQPFTDMVDRKEIPRMPWHDIGCMVAGKGARDVARHFIQRWNYTKLTKQKTNKDYPMILPKSYSKISLPQWVVNESYCANCQILRSSCEWSAGIKTIECSIHEAYIDLILKAKHFIYIENQFFVTIMDHDVVENQISRALYERILAAHKKKETFRVYVVMPLLPAFEGELGTNTGTSIQAVTHWNYASICRGGKSLLERLTKELRDPFEYISFYGLRTHEKLVNKLATELVYVHSKLMIVDDRNVILGSANINDRSMLGKRDSEIAIVIEDTNFKTTTFNGVEVQVGQFASDMRRNIFREHLGVSENNPLIDVSDPVAAVFYKATWLNQASINTSVYEQVFNCIPSDKVLTYHQLRDFQKEIPMAIINPEKAEKRLKKVKGNLVLLPLLFLSKEHLGNLTGTKEGLMPNIIWT